MFDDLLTTIIYKKFNLPFGRLLTVNFTWIQGMKNTFQVYNKRNCKLIKVGMLGYFVTVSVTR